MAGRRSRRWSDSPFPTGQDQYLVVAPSKAQQHGEIERWRQFAHEQIENGCTPEIPCQVPAPRKCRKKRCSRSRKKKVCREVEVWPPPMPKCPPRPVYQPQCPPRSTVYPPPCPPTACPPIPGHPQMICLPLSQCPPAVRQAVTRDLPAASRQPKPLSFPVFSTRNPPTSVYQPARQGDTNFYHRRHHAILNCEERYERHRKSVPMPLPMPGASPDMYGPLPDPDLYGCSDPWENCGFRPRGRATTRYKSPERSKPAAVSPSWYTPAPLSRSQSRPVTRRRRSSSESPSPPGSPTPVTAAVSTQWSSPQVNKVPSLSNPCNCANNGKDCKDVSCSCSSLCPPPKPVRKARKSIDSADYGEEETRSQRVNFEVYMALGTPTSDGQDLTPLPTPVSDTEGEDEEEATGIPVTGSRSVMNLAANPDNNNEGSALTKSKSNLNVRGNLKARSSPNLSNRSNYSLNMPPNDFRGGPEFSDSESSDSVDTLGSRSRSRLQLRKKPSPRSARSVTFQPGTPDPDDDPYTYRGRRDTRKPQANARSPRNMNNRQRESSMDRPSPRSQRSSQNSYMEKPDDDPYEEVPQRKPRRRSQPPKQNNNGMNDYLEQWKCHAHKLIEQGCVPPPPPPPCYPPPPPRCPHQPCQPMPVCPPPCPPGAYYQYYCPQPRPKKKRCPPPYCPIPCPVFRPPPRCAYPYSCPPPRCMDYYHQKSHCNSEYAKYCAPVDCCPRPRPRPVCPPACPPRQCCTKPPSCRPCVPACKSYPIICKCSPERRPSPCRRKPKVDCCCSDDSDSELCLKKTKGKPKDKKTPAPKEPNSSTNSSKPTKSSSLETASSESVRYCERRNNRCRKKPQCCIREKPCCCCKQNLQSKYGCSCCNPGPCCIPGPRAPCPCLRPACGNQSPPCPCACPCNKIPRINICVKPHPPPKPPMIITCEDTPCPPPPPRCLTVVPACCPPPCCPPPCCPPPCYNPCFPCPPRLRCCPPGQVVVQEIGACPDNYFSKPPKDGSVNLRIPQGQGNRHNTCIKIAMSPEIQTQCLQNPGFVNSVLRTLVEKANPFNNC